MKQQYRIKYCHFYLDIDEKHFFFFLNVYISKRINLKICCITFNVFKRNFYL